jgi:hypothetical protein
VNRINFNSKELASKYFLRLRMIITSFHHGIKNYREFQIISNYIKPVVLYAINFLFKKSEKSKSNVSRIEAVNLGGYTYSYRNLEMDEH